MLREWDGSVLCAMVLLEAWSPVVFVGWWRAGCHWAATMRQPFREHGSCPMKAGVSTHLLSCVGIFFGMCVTYVHVCVFTHVHMSWCWVLSSSLTAFDCIYWGRVSHWILQILWVWLASSPGILSLPPGVTYKWATMLAELLCGCWGSQFWFSCLYHSTVWIYLLSSSVQCGF